MRNDLRSKGQRCQSWTCRVYWSTKFIHSPANISLQSPSSGRNQDDCYSNNWRLDFIQLTLAHAYFWQTQSTGDISKVFQVESWCITSSWELLLTKTNWLFHRTIRNTSTSTDEQFHRSPSAPSLLDLDGRTETAVASTSAPKFRRASAVPKMKTRNQPLKNIQRAVSVDCPTSPSKSRNVPEVTKLPSGILTTSKQPSSPSKRSEMGPKAHRVVSYRTSLGQSASCSAEIEESYLEELEEPCCSKQNKETQAGERKSTSVQFKTHNPVVHFHSATVELHSHNETKNLHATQSWDRKLESRTRPVSAGTHRHFETMAARPDAPPTIAPTFAKTRFRSESTGRPVLIRQTHIEQTEVMYASNPEVEAIVEENAWASSKKCLLNVQ